MERVPINVLPALLVACMSGTLEEVEGVGSGKPTAYSITATSE